MRSSQMIREGYRKRSRRPDSMELTVDLAFATLKGHLLSCQVGDAGFADEVLSPSIELLMGASHGRLPIEHRRFFIELHGLMGKVPDPRFAALFTVVAETKENWEKCERMADEFFLIERDPTPPLPEDELPEPTLFSELAPAAQLEFLIRTYASTYGLAERLPPIARTAFAATVETAARELPPLVITALSHRESTHGVARRQLTLDLLRAVDQFAQNFDGALSAIRREHPDFSKGSYPFQDGLLFLQLHSIVGHAPIRTSPLEEEGANEKKRQIVQEALEGVRRRFDQSPDQVWQRMVAEMTKELEEHVVKEQREGVALSLLKIMGHCPPTDDPLLKIVPLVCALLDTAMESDTLLCLLHRALHSSLLTLDFSSGSSPAHEPIPAEFAQEIGRRVHSLVSHLVALGQPSGASWLVTTAAKGLISLFSGTIGHAVASLSQGMGSLEKLPLLFHAGALFGLEDGPDGTYVAGFKESLPLSANRRAEMVDECVKRINEIMPINTQVTHNWAELTVALTQWPLTRELLLYQYILPALTDSVSVSTPRRPATDH